ncbi:hypothetical protein K501DRAFT_334016 [Backusella circina FSU 941]|nr:hypothetical protein K501DRAFT_334016 [Backusella circina FSU 941]
MLRDSIKAYKQTISSRSADTLRYLINAKLSLFCMTDYTFLWPNKEQVYKLWDQISNSGILFSNQKDNLRWQNLCWRCWHMQRSTLQYIYTPKFYLDGDDLESDCYLKDEYNNSMECRSDSVESDTIIRFEKKENRQPCIQPVSLLSQMLKSDMKQPLRRCPTRYNDLSRWFSKQQLVS